MCSLASRITELLPHHWHPSPRPERILLFINRSIHAGAAVGDPDQELLNALLACGFISVLQDVLQEQGSNMQRAAELKKPLERIQCTGKSSVSSQGDQEKK